MPNNLESVLGLLIFVAALLASTYYGRLVAQLRRDGGQVKTNWVGLPDIPMSLIVGGTLGLLAGAGFLQSGKKVELKPDQVLPGMIFLIVLAGGIAVFLALRKQSLSSLLGLRNLSAPRAIGRGFLMLLAAVPVVLMFSITTMVFLHEDVQEQQELVKLFSNATQQGDMDTVLLIMLTAVVIAPVCEELVFRGYFYPVAKRFFGPGAGAVMVAALFAASHVNLPSLPGLFALALCFTVAYERSGSILVPMTMHACFNAANLFMLYVSALPPR